MVTLSVSLQLYQDNQVQIRRILNQLIPSQPAFHQLEWRLDVQVRVLEKNCQI